MANYGDPNDATIGTTWPGTPSPFPTDAQGWLGYYNQIMQSLGNGSSGNQASNLWNAFTTPINPILQNFGIESDPKLGFQAYTALVGQQNPTYQNWLGGKYNDYYGQYQALQTVDPTMKWTNFLSTIDPNKDYSFSDPYSRGGYFNASSQYAPNMKLVV